MQLAPKNKLALTQVEQELSKNTSLFSRNLLTYAENHQIELPEDANLKGVEPMEQAKLKAFAKNKKLNGYLLPMDPALLLHVLRNAEDPELRRKIFLMWRGQGSTDGANNHPVIQKIVELRQKKAQILGYATYADLVLKNRMVGLLAKLKDVLDQTYTQAKPFADKEFKLLQGYAKERFGIDHLMPWDLYFVRAQYSKENLNYDQQKIKEYFTLERAMEGVFTLAQKIYGLSFTYKPDLPVYAPGVKIFEVKDIDGRILGHLMIDPYSRTGQKKNGAWENSMIGGFRRTGHRQQVFASIDLNLSRSVGEDPTLMTLGEVQTLFHEFGHALHSLMSDTRYFSISKNEVLWDFVELPSMLNEKFLKHPEVLAWFARHYKTGETFPKEYLDAANQLERFMAGYDLMASHLSYSALDLAYHTGQYKGGSIFEFERQVTDKFKSPGQEDWPHLLSGGFSHIFSGGYASGYYSYFWAGILRASAFHEFEKQGVISREVGDHFRRTILSVGNSVDPLQAFINFTGHEPDVQDLLRELGLDK